MSTGRGGGDGNPAVSVVIPTRDRWPLLATTLASALGQDGVPLEVVVVDDGSATAAPVAAPFDDPRVRIVRNDRSLGVAGARNRGIEAARGGGSRSSTTTTSGHPRSCGASSTRLPPRGRRSPTPG